MKKCFCDTNVLMEFSSDIINSYDKIYVCGHVLNELDKHKMSSDENKRFQARRAGRDLENNQDKVEYVIREGSYALPTYFNVDNQDNKIISIYTDLYINDNELICLSNDLLFRQKCRLLKLPCEKFEGNTEIETYTGIRETFVTEQEYDDIVDDCYKNLFNLYPNEYLIIHTTNKDRKYLHMWNGEYLEEVKARSITNSFLKGNSKKKDKDKDESGKILPLDIYQRAFIHMLQNDNVKIKITDSIYGAGKSFLMINWAIQMAEKKKLKIYFIKSDSPPKNRKPFPAIPGGVDEKCDPNLQVINDSVPSSSNEKSVLKTLIDDKKLEVVPIQFAKGRSLKNAIFYINEAQDFTPSEMERILSRLGEGSFALVDGSTQQIDNNYCSNRNGLTVTSLNFKDKLISAQVNMVVDYRSELSKMVSEMDWHD